MKTDDIRPPELVKENLRLYQRDIVNMLSNSAQWVAVPCPACGGGMGPADTAPVAFVKDGFYHRRCHHCGTLFISPRPPPEMLLDFYCNGLSIQHWAQELYPRAEAHRMMGIAAPRAHFVRDACVFRNFRPRKLVDVGCGDGAFLDSVRMFMPGLEVTGVEPNHELAMLCKKRGLNVVEVPIESVAFFDRVDIITAFEVLEHLFDPHAFVFRAYSMLEENGLLIMTMPNADGFDIAMLGAESDDVGGPNHLQYFTTSSIVCLLEGAGFQVLEGTTPGALDVERVRAKVLADRVHLKGQPFLREVLVDRWAELGPDFQEFLAEHGMSSHMRVVARRGP